MGILFPLEGEDEELVAIPLTCPMGQKNLPPIFCTATKTVADIVNAALRCNTHALLHRLNGMADAIFRDAPPTLQTTLEGLTRYP